LVLSEPPSSTMTNFDLSATFINLQRLLSEAHTFTTYTSEFPNGGQVNALMSHLISKKSWNLQPSFSSTNSRVFHNPSYTYCIKSGSFWFDSPVYEEAGCYTPNDFVETYKKRVENLKDMDLAYHRTHGYCVRYKEEAYNKAKNPPPPAPKAEGKKPEEKKTEEKKPEEKPEEKKPEEKKPEEKKAEEKKPEEKKSEEKKPEAKDIVVLDGSGVKTGGPGAEELKKLQKAADDAKKASSSNITSTSSVLMSSTNSTVPAATLKAAAKD